MTINDKIFLFGLSLLGIKLDNPILIDYDEPRKINYITSKFSDKTVSMFYNGDSYLVRYEFQVNRQNRLRLFRQKEIPKSQESRIIIAVFFV